MSGKVLLRTIAWVFIGPSRLDAEQPPSRLNRWTALLLAVLVFSGGGCGTFMARRIAQAPNSYPTWLAPKARVELGLSPRMLTNFPAHFVAVGPPAARLRYRIVDPADYHLTVSATNWFERGHSQFHFTFHADIPGATNRWTGAPRGTVIVLHGWGVAQFAMAPWALRLAQEGWRCVLVDLRGHGKSTGKRIYFGLQEAHDLSQLLDELARNGQLREPVASLGESYGASLSLRWMGGDSRVRGVVAIAPYAELSTAILNITHDYAPWMPSCLLKPGLKQLPALLHAPPGELDTSTILARHPVPALFVAAGEDAVTPVGDVERLQSLAAAGSKLVIVPRATHEAVTYFFPELTPPVLNWLADLASGSTKK